MNIEIRNPKENQYGNSKENIFHAFELHGDYLGTAYTYPAVNYYQTHETPYIIFVDVNMAVNIEPALSSEARQLLFEKVMVRARELRCLKPDIRARIYSGFVHNPEKLDFYLGNGFEEDYSIIMEAELSKDFAYVLPEGYKAVDCDFTSEDGFQQYKTLYDRIFITPMDRDLLMEQAKLPHFKNLYFMAAGKLLGGCTVFEQDGFGYIETLFVLPEMMGKGISKLIMNYIFKYFSGKGLKKSRLEVWQLNKRAIELYKRFGYAESQRNLMFPGITL